MPLTVLNLSSREKIFLLATLKIKLKERDDFYDE